MEQFSLDKWLQDKSRKVVTRDGRKVRILCIDCGVRESEPILVEITCSRNAKVLEYYNIDGTTQDKNLNLFFADEEPIIEIPFGAKDSEFIKDEYFIPEGCKARIEGNKVIIERIKKEKDTTKIVEDICGNIKQTKIKQDKMELTKFDECLLSAFYSVAGKVVMTIGTASFQEDLNEWSKTLLDLARKELQPEFEAELDRAYKCADKVQYENGKKDAMKNIPSWKKASGYKEFDKHVILLERDNRVCLTEYVNDGEYYIVLDDLKTLPKE